MQAAQHALDMGQRPQSSRLIWCSLLFCAISAGAAVTSAYFSGQAHRRAEEAVGRADRAEERAELAEERAEREEKLFQEQVQFFETQATVLKQQELRLARGEILYLLRQAEEKCGGCWNCEPDYSIRIPLDYALRLEGTIGEDLTAAEYIKLHREARYGTLTRLRLTARRLLRLLSRIVIRWIVISLSGSLATPTSCTTATRRKYRQV